MDLKDILQSRNKQIDECRDLIKSLNNIKDSNKCDELKSLLRRKKDLLVELNAENYQDTIKELKIINEKIYVSSNIIRSNINRIKELKIINEEISILSNIIRSKINNLLDFRNLNPILINLTTKDSELKFRDIFKFFLNNQFITTFIFLLIGSFVFSIYFLEIDYFPVLNKESFIYFLFLLSGIGILYTLSFLIIPIIIGIIFSKIFQIEYIKEDKKIFFVFFILVASFIFFIIYPDKNIDQIIFILVFLSLICYISYKILNNITNYIIIFIYIYIILLLLIIFFYFINQLGEYISQRKNLISMLIFLAGVFLMLFTLNPKRAKLILYIMYLTYGFCLLISMSPDVMKQLHFGNYTPDVLILKPETKDIIPSNFPYLNNTLKKPKILSNIGDEYYIELETAPNKTLRLSIPKNLVLSEQNKVEEKPKETKDTTKPSKPKENISQ